MQFSILLREAKQTKHIYYAKLCVIFIQGKRKTCTYFGFVDTPIQTLSKRSQGKL